MCARQASRKAGHIEPFTYTDLLVAKGKNLDIVTQAETIEPHRHVREDLWRSSWAYYVVELADAFTQEADPNDLLFDLLLETLSRLDQQGMDYGLAVRYYELHLLALVGFQPQLFRCVQCNELLKPEVNFLSLEQWRLPVSRNTARIGPIRSPFRCRCLRFCAICNRGTGSRSPCCA